MRQVYYIGSQSVIPIDGLRREELFRGINVHPHRPTDAELAAGQREILHRLREWLPDYIDETAQPGKPSRGLFSTTEYAIPTPNGRVDVRVNVLDNLGEEIRNKGNVTEGENEEGRFKGKSGIVMHASYHWNGNSGERDTPKKYPDDTGDFRNVFESTVNALCRETQQVGDIIRIDASLGNPLWLRGNETLEAGIRNASLESIRALDQPVAEFMRWLRENRVQINTVSGYAWLAWHQYQTLKIFQQEGEARVFGAALSTRVREAGERYSQLAQEAFDQLKPLRNNRMDYLIH